MTSPTYSLTITEADLDRAIARRAEARYDTCAHCLLAYALRRQEGRGVRIGFVFEPPSGGRFTARDTAAERLIHLFDTQEYDRLRQRLPVTFELPAKVN